MNPRRFFSAMFSVYVLSRAWDFGVSMLAFMENELLFLATENNRAFASFMENPNLGDATIMGTGELLIGASIALFFYVYVREAGFDRKNILVYFALMCTASFVAPLTWFHDVFRRPFVWSNVVTIVAHAYIIGGMFKTAVLDEGIREWKHVRGWSNWP